MATNYSNGTLPDNEYYEVFDDAYAVKILGSIFHNANIYFTPLLILYGDLVSILALAIIIGRRLWLRHEGYVYLVALFVSNVLELTLRYGSFAAEAAFGFSSLKHSSRFMCKMVYFLDNLFFVPVCVTTLLLVNAYLRLILTQQSQQEQSWRRRCFTTLARVYCTPFVSKIVTGAMLPSMCLFNVWALWMTDFYYGYCTLRETGSFNLEYWDLFTVTVLLIFPVLILIPVLTTIIWYIGRTSRCFQFFKMDEQVSDVEFVRLTLWYSVVVFLSELPMVIVLVYSHATEHIYATLIWALLFCFMLVHGISLCVLSSLCLFGLTSFRNEIRSRFKCCRWRRSTEASLLDSEDQEERGNGDLHLDPI